MKLILNRDILSLIDQAKEKVKESDVYKDICKEYKAKSYYIDNVAVVFSPDLDVSARTDGGVIYINAKYIEDIDETAHYIVHEFTHWCQQCLGDGPTYSPDSDDYLADDNELEGFKNQVEFIKENEDYTGAKDYVDKLLDHHDVDGKEREKYEKKLGV